MKPIRTPASNFTYLGPSPDIGDLPCQRVPHDGSVRSTWELTDEERQAIAEGAHIELAIYAEPIPPVSLGLAHPTPPEIAAVGEARPFA